MSKRKQKMHVGERVTAKSKPMMNLVSRCSEKTTVVLHSTASESPVKTRHESKPPPSLQTEQHQRTGRPFLDAYSSSYSEWNVDKNWSSQEWKSDELMEERTGRPVVTAQHTDKFIFVNIHIILAQGEWSSAKDSRSILKKMQHKTVTNILWYGECSCLQHWKHLYSWTRITWKFYIP